MPFFLRKIRKARWANDKGYEWLGAEDIQADALSDLKTENNELSVWHVEEDESNLRQIVVALGANYKKLDTVDYALVDQRVLLTAGIKAVEAAGDTPYENANEWHRNLIELTAEKVIEIAKNMRKERRIARVWPQDLQRHLTRAIEAGEVKLSRLEERLQKELQGRTL
jgi:hypothetical protein